MYPTVVMLLVESQRSMMNVCEISLSNASKLAGPAASEARPATLNLGHLSSATGPVHITSDNEAESRLSRVLQSQGRQECGLEEGFLEIKESQVGSGPWLTDTTTIPDTPTLHTIQC